MPKVSSNSTRRVRAGSRRVGLDCSILPTMTQQQFKNECDINNIMAKYNNTGVINFKNDIKSGRYIDLTTVSDYHSSLNKVLAAQDAFDDLPAKVRSYFNNDPAQLLQFVADPKNAAKAFELGLTKVAPKPAEPSSASSPAAAPLSSAAPTNQAPSPDSAQPVRRL